MRSTVRIKDHYAEQHLFFRRALVIGGGALLAILVLIGRLVWLQIVQYDYFFELSQGNRIRNKPLPPNRGLILDRNGVALGLNAPSYQLELTREQVPNLDNTLQGLASLALLDRADLPQLKKDILSRRGFETVPVKLQLNDDELARFAVRQQDFPGVEIQPRMTRYYPLAGSAVHATGYVSAISIEDQKNIDVDDYAGTTLIGKSGVERAYEKELHGTTGYEQLLVNAQGRRVEPEGLRLLDLKRKEPVAGNDLYLTIDQRVQQAAEEMLRGRRAAAVAIDPDNGDVIALVSTPGFDPNLFARGIAREDYRALTSDPDLPLYDRALRGTYASASTIKPFMGLAGLQYGVIESNETWYCRGQFRLPNVSRPWRDWKPAGHGNLDLAGAIQQSCDTYFYQVADLLGIDRIHAFLSQFGFGAATGIDIGGDKTGILPSTEWKRRAFQKNKDMQTWYRGETVSVGIGQGYLSITPVQLAHATATLAKRGQRFKPRLVRAIRDPVTGALREIAPLPLPSVQVKAPQMWDVVFKGMQMVTKPGGTASVSAMGAQYLIAGKTGTAQVINVGQNENMKAFTARLAERLKDHGLFVAFAPAENPRLAVAVVIENGEHGSTAALIARRMFDAYFLTAEALKEQDAKGKSPGLTSIAASGDDE
ncbi:MAG: penicillin-binding protein 2 [Candidatus Obscuribacterales bacterium]|nr:penicillin-binding protein 2 [Steroidobacteraceae bacterium]